MLLKVALVLACSLARTFASPVSSTSPKPEPSSTTTPASAHASGSATLEFSSSASSTRSSSSPSAIPSGSSGGVSQILPEAVQVQLNATLNSISAGAADRWVTASPIRSTNIGSANSTDSNLELSRLVDHAFTDVPSNPSPDGWAETYVKFLQEAGTTNATDEDRENILANFTTIEPEYAAAQVALVQAYEAANKNFTYIGVNIYNVSRIPALTMTAIEKWGANSSDGSYSKDDYAKYVQLNQSFVEIEEQYAALEKGLQIALEGDKYKILLNMAPAMFNFTMDVGGGVVVPKWGATIVNNSVITPSVLQQFPPNSTATAPPSDTPLPRSTLPPVSASASSSATITASPVAPSARAAEPSSGKRGLAVLQAVAKNSSINDDSPQITSSAGTPAPSGNINHAGGEKAVAGASVNASVSVSEPKGNFMFLEIVPGSWVEHLATNIAWAKSQNPDVLTKYFGSHGEGPIGRIWTHICILTTDDPDKGGLSSVQVLGMVYDTIPL